VTFEREHELERAEIRTRDGGVEKGNGKGFCVDSEGEPRTFRVSRRVSNEVLPTKKLIIIISPKLAPAASTEDKNGCGSEEGTPVVTGDGER
jgi:hypothetical protein